MPTFSYTSGNPNNLTASNDASMGDIQGPLTDLRTFINGGLGTSNLAANAGVLETQLASAGNGLAKGAFAGYLTTTPGTGLGPAVVQFNAEDFDVSGWFDITTNRGRYTPQVAGYYRLSAACLFSSTGAGNWLALHLYKNGALHRTLQQIVFAAAAFGQTASGSAVVQANGSTDYFEVVWQASAAAAPVGTAAGSYFTGELVGRS
jgi:hypothetical protein